jgi:predicted Fe-Mo cluster-binding NifX family protein
MKIAIPESNGLLCMHFGHCDMFAIIDVDESSKQIISENLIQPPPHEPGLLPRWLHEMGANLIIAGGMGARAVNLFTQADVKVITGAPAIAPRQIVEAYLTGNLVTGGNTCDH